jgi:hypothetical protein
MMYERNNWQDWLRLMAFLLMVAMHAGFVWKMPLPVAAALFAASRICFPVFAIIAAENFFRADDREEYLRKLLPWGLASEPFFYLVTGSFGNAIVQIWLGLAFVEYGNIAFAIACALCDFGASGLAALVVWSAVSRQYRIAGGLVACAWPWSAFSALGALLPALRINLPAVPFALHRVFRIGYPAHLAAFALLGVAK